MTVYNITITSTLRRGKSKTYECIGDYFDIHSHITMVMPNGDIVLEPIANSTILYDKKREESVKANKERQYQVQLLKEKESEMIENEKKEETSKQKPAKIKKKPLKSE